MSWLGSVTNDVASVAPSEGGDAAKQHRLATVPVAQPAADDRPEEHPDVAGGQRRCEGDGRHVPRLDELRHHVPERAQIVALEDDHQPAEQRRAQCEGFVRACQFTHRTGVAETARRGFE